MENAGTHAVKCHNVHEGLGKRVKRIAQFRVGNPAHHLKGASPRRATIARCRQGCAHRQRGRAQVVGRVSHSVLAESGGDKVRTHVVASNRYGKPSTRATWHNRHIIGVDRARWKAQQCTGVVQSKQPRLVLGIAKQCN
eukprot:scaffold36314_cov31-Tisochrysis_lutea.AAC.7